MSRHADAALMVVDVPWKALLADTSAAVLVRRDNLRVAQLWRQHAMPIVATIELANGLDRRAEDDGRRGRMVVGVGTGRDIVTGSAGALHPPADATR